MTETQAEQVKYLSHQNTICRLPLSDQNTIKTLARKLIKELPISGAESVHLERIHSFWGQLN